MPDQSEHAKMQIESFSFESPLGEFTKINYKGFGNVTLKHGTKPMLKVSSKFEIEEAVKFEILNNVLRIKIKDSLGLVLKVLMRLESPDLKLEITYTNLEEVIFNGMGNLQNIEVIEAFDFSIVNNGIGLVELNLDVKTLESKLDGAGSIVLKGSSEEHICKLNGAGKIDAKELEAESAKATSNGIGSLSIYASKKIEARLNGIGNISHYGNPDKVESIIKGMGSIVAGS